MYKQTQKLTFEAWRKVRACLTAITTDCLKRKQKEQWTRLEVRLHQESQQMAYQPQGASSGWTHVLLCVEAQQVKQIQHLEAQGKVQVSKHLVRGN